MARWVWLLLLSAALLADVARAQPAPPADASDADRAAARALFEDGRALMTQRRYPEACAKFEASRRLVAGVGTLFQLASCYEAIGRTATAWALYLDVVAETEAQGEVAKAKAAQERADALAPKLCRLLVDVQPRPPGLSVTRDGRPIHLGELGSAVPVDPGSHEISASAPAHRAATQQVVISAAQAGSTIRVALALLADAAPPAAPSLPAEPPGDYSGVIVAGWTVGLLGVTGTAVGAALLVVGQSREEEALAECPDFLCANPMNYAYLDESQRLQDVGGIMLGAALSAVAAGAGMLIGGYVAQPANPGTRAQLRARGVALIRW